MYKLNYHDEHTAEAVEDLGTSWTCFGLFWEGGDSLLTCFILARCSWIEHFCYCYFSNSRSVCHKGICPWWNGLYLLELSSAPLCRRPQRQDRCGYSGSVCIHDHKPTAADHAAELTVMGSTSVFSPQYSLGKGKVKSNSTWLLLSKSHHNGSRETSFEKCVTFPWKVLLLPYPYFCFPVDLEDFNIQFLKKCAYIFLTIWPSVGLTRNRVSACTVEIILDKNKLNFSPE